MNKTELVIATDLNQLFAKLETIRQKHVAANGQSASISSAFPTAPATSKTTFIASSLISQLNTELSNLKNSSWNENVSTSTTTTGDAGTAPKTTLNSQLTDNFTIPSTSSLITATDFNHFKDVLDEIDAICPVYSTRYFRYSQYSQYTGQYTGQYTSQYGQYSGRYSGQYTGQYSAEYSGRYSAYSRYGGQYGRYGRSGSYSKYQGKYNRYSRS